MKKITLIPEVEIALQAYANSHGKSWKDDLLMSDWPMCRPAGILINLRNSAKLDFRKTWTMFNPNWLRSGKKLSR